MKFKGTKGKWTFNHNMVTTVEIKTDDTICLKPAILDDNWEANALLISKAPEMFDMLEKCRTQLILCTLLDRSGQCLEMVDEIEQLIKEATELKSE